MKTKNKLLLFAAMVAVFAVTQISTVKAGPSDRALPEEDDIFWQVLSVMDTPADTTACQAKIDELAGNDQLEAYINAHRDELMDEGDPQGGDWEGGGPTAAEMAQGFYQMCTMLAQMPTEMQTGMAQDGVTSSLFDAADWHNVSGLYFQKTGEGRIAFTNTIDFLTYRFFRFMSNFDAMVKMEDGFISLNPSMATDIKNYGAQLTMYGLNFSETPDIYVDGKKAGSGDVEGATYNASEGSLTFTAKHWSSYKAVAKGTKVKAMKINSLTKKSKSIKYNARKSTFKVTFKGKNLKKASGQTATCTLGFESANKVSINKKGTQATCVFTMSYFSDKGTFPLTLNISGKGETSKTNAVRIR
ncbi:MAG: hypothetical protein V1690_03415 [Candidatus Moraniibacteriota bacterium]